MGIRNYLKKLGKRASGSWGRINSQPQMRAESKALRQEAKSMTQEDIDRWLYEDSVKDLDLLNDEEPH